MFRECHKGFALRLCKWHESLLSLRVNIECNVRIRCDDFHIQNLTEMQAFQFWFAMVSNFSLCSLKGIFTLPRYIKLITRFNR